MTDPLESNAMNNGNNQLDTSIETVTPENVLLQYQLSGPFRRLLAYVIDVLIRIGVYLVMTIAFSLLFGALSIEGVGVAILFLLYFVLSWFYGGLLEAYWNGQTIGKRAMGIRVLTLSGEPINALQAILRNVLREVDSLTPFFVPLVWFIPFATENFNFPIPTYLVGLIAMICTKRFQRLGDLACGTMVVVEQRSWNQGLLHIDDAEVLQLASLLPANLEVSRSLGQTLSHYVERRRVFPPARRADLAKHIGVPLCRRFGLPPNTNHDMLLCAMYYRTFISDQLDEEELAPPLPSAPLPLASSPPAPSSFAGPAESTSLPLIKPKREVEEVEAFPEIQTPPISSRFGDSP